MATKSGRKSKNSTRKSQKKKRRGNFEAGSAGLARQAVEDSPGAFELREALFFFTKFFRMRNQAASGAARRMFHMQQLVKQDIFHRKLRYSRPVHAAVQ